MANKMLIDASHQEETRVVVVRGSRIEEFDFESEHKKQLKGNIYLAKVTRVEPSLQAAFVEYGGNRHGFLAFSEIHPDYYQIPMADRQALIEEDLARAQEDEESEERKPARPRGRGRRDPKAAAAKVESEGGDSVSEAVSDGEAEERREAADEEIPTFESSDSGSAEDGAPGDGDGDDAANAGPSAEDGLEAGASSDEESGEEHDEKGGGRRRRARGRSRNGEDEGGEENGEDEADQVDEIGAEDAMEEVPVRQSRPRRQYKIQEVIKRRQILLVQVVKEERGNKGAALTTYLSLAGRYSVLMPNTARGGGISRKITNAADRKRLKEVARDLEVPRGMGIILRTAGANRTKAEVKRDYEYLMRLWETVRNLTLSSIAPSLVYEEGSLIKRSIRDLYNKDIDQILVSGENGYREAKDFMRMLMPSQAKVVQPYRDPTPIFTRQGIEAQLDRMLQPHVTLKSGGYIIINQTEALVAIDVNSGRSTREHSVEDTAYQTNLEAAEEVARQLRLRDLAGLIVIDFIDMEEKRNNRNVEKKLKDCLKNDRARIQVGRISHFGLMEMSRQRIRASVLESTMQTCPTCAGAGHIRSASSLALHVLRSIEEHLQKHSSHDLIVKVPTATALYVLNEKRSTIADLERFHGLRITIEADETLGHQGIQIEHGAEAVRREPKPEYVHPETIAAEDIIEDTDVIAEETASVSQTSAESTEERSESASRGRKRRRRRRRGGEEEVSASSEDRHFEDGEDETGTEDGEDESAEREASEDEESGRARKRRRRGRRGGRKNRDDAVGETDGSESAAVAAGGEELSSTEPGDAFASASGHYVEVSGEPESADGLETATGTPAGNDIAERETAAGEERDVSLQDNAPLAAAGAEEEAIEANDRLDAPETSEDAGAAPTEAGGADRPADLDVANVNGDARPAEAPREPQVTSSTPEAPDAESDRPKRTGWWARRSFF